MEWLGAKEGYLMLLQERNFMKIKSCNNSLKSVGGDLAVDKSHTEKNELSKKSASEIPAPPEPMVHPMFRFILLRNEFACLLRITQKKETQPVEASIILVKCGLVIESRRVSPVYFQRNSLDVCDIAVCDCWLELSAQVVGILAPKLELKISTDQGNKTTVSYLSPWNCPLSRMKKMMRHGKSAAVGKTAPSKL